jgi:hypothetical protein
MIKFKKGSTHDHLHKILVQEGVFEYWYNRIDMIERLPGLMSRNGVDEIVISEELREELKGMVGGIWRDVLFDFIDSADLWSFVKEIGREQDEKDKS